MCNGCCTCIKESGAASLNETLVFSECLLEHNYDLTPFQYRNANFKLIHMYMQLVGLNIVI